MKNYTFLGISNGKKFCISGVDVFLHKWRSLGECDIVLHPKTKKPFSFSLYEIETENKKLQFLAGKFDTDDWAFYIEATDDDFIF